MSLEKIFKIAAIILQSSTAAKLQWTYSGACLISHACCGYQLVCIHLCLFSLGSKPQPDSHLEAPTCFAHKQARSKLAAQKACGLECCCPTPQLHYWAMLMIQSPLIYSLFNTLSLALKIRFYQVEVTASFIILDFTPFSAKKNKNN